MEVSMETKTGAGIIALTGDLDFQSFRELEQAFELAMTSGPERVIVEISGVPHIDSVGLGTLTRLWREANKKGVTVALAGPRKNVSSMIKLVNLDGRIKLFNSVSEALS